MKPKDKKNQIQETESETQKTIDRLQRALFYETQYRVALTSGALSFFDINLSKDLIESDFYYKNENDELISLPEYIGLSTPCCFSEFIYRWADEIVPDLYKRKVKLENETPAASLVRLFNEGKRDYTIEYWAELKNGKKIFLHHKFLLTKNENDEVCALCVIKDYTNILSVEEEYRSKEIEQYAYFDPITKGYNYIKFKEKLNRLNMSGVIIAVDIKSFKIINSICGITKGDQVIKGIWDCIMNSLDTEHDELAAHINADHFIIFLPFFDTDKIQQKIKSITYTLTIASSSLEVPLLQPYFGVSEWQSGKRIELSYSESVAAKRNAKEQTDVNYAFFEEKDTQRLVEEKTMIDSFENALARKDFKIWYQPKYSPVSKKLVGAEALVRWQNTDGTMVSPAKFIPVFEANGMIRTLDEYIFRNVCKQQKRWLKEGLDIVPVSINLSRVSLYYKNIVNTYQRIADEIGVDTKYLPIEITESAAVNNIAIKDIADSFYKAGFVLHMDDFGSGYSSLASLNLMHFETLKLDKSLIDFIGNFSGDRLIEHTIYLAKELGIHVTAEGVEKESQVSFLNHIGCDSIQGYFYSKPVPVDDFTEKLKEAMKEEKSTPVDYLAEHITDFNQSLFIPPLYSFAVNVTQNYFTERSGSSSWHKELNFCGDCYSEGFRYVADNLILPEYRESYINFMDRDRILENYKGKEQTSLLQYKRKYNDGIAEMRILSHVFMVEDSKDLWMYFTVSKLNG